MKHFEIIYFKIIYNEFDLGHLYNNAGSKHVSTLERLLVRKMKRSCVNHVALTHLQYRKLNLLLFKMLEIESRDMFEISFDLKGFFDLDPSWYKIKKIITIFYEVYDKSD